MAEVSKPSASTTASSAQSPTRGPRRILKQDKATSTPLEVSNVLVPEKPNPAARSRSYGEKLIHSVTSLSSEVATAATLQNEYAKADKAQKAINRHYEKLRNLSHFPAARDLVKRTREAQNKNVESLKERLNERNSKQKSLSKQAAALVDEETSTSTLPNGILKTLQDEAKSTKLSLQDIRNDMATFSRNSRAVFDRRFAELERNSEESYRFGRETRSCHDKLLEELRRHSNLQSDLIQKMKTSQTEDFASLRRTRERLDRAISDIDLLKDRLAAQSQRRNAGQSTSPPAVHPRSVTAIEDRLNALESLVQRQSSSGTPPVDILMKAVNQLSARLDGIERQGRSETQPSVQAQGDSSYHVKELAKIKEQIEDMKALNEYKDTILCDDIEKKQKDMVMQLEQTIGQIKAEVASAVEKAVSDMESKMPIKQTDAISSLAEAAELHGQRFESLETAIGSLESRYGHITAEALAYQAISIIQRQFPPPQILHNVIERFQLLEMKFSQIGSLGDHLSEHAEAQSRKLDALQGQIRAAQAAQAEVQAQAQAQAQVAAARIESQDKSANSETSALITQIQNKWPEVLQQITELHKLHGDMKLLDSRFSAYAEENRQKLEQIQQSLKKSSTATDEVITKTSSMANSIGELKTESQAQKSQFEDLTQSRDSQTQAMEQKLTDKITQLQDQIQNAEQKISDMLDVSNLGELKLSLENQEVALQQHVESLSYQLSQLVDQQKAAAADLSQLQQVNEQLKKFTYDSIEELQKVVKDVNHQQTAEQGKILKETLNSHAFRLDELEKAQTPRARNRSSNSISPDATSSHSRFSNSDDEYYDIESGYVNNGSSRQKKSKRKFSKVYAFGSTPSRAPASMIERSGPPPFKKRQRSMLDLVNSGD